MLVCMALLTSVEYKTKLVELKDISPAAVLDMLSDVRASIAKLDIHFAGADLAKVLTAVEAGKYEVCGDITACIDLSSAKGVIHAYRMRSEGGCQSCTHLGRETIDAQDASSGWYCEVSDPDYDKTAIGDKPRCRYANFSPKVKKHYDLPCESWQPQFSLRLAEFIKGAN
jgi:hypothetical protein